ncbi:TPA: hypothetical protein ACH3X1_002715 [Trebouxia sp. C0004]
MSDSDSDSSSAGRDAHAPKARKGQDGRVAKLRNRFEHPTSQALTVVLARRSARVASAGQLHKQANAAGLPADALAELVARIRALEQNQVDSQQLRSDLLQTQIELVATRSELLKAQTELTAACFDLAEFKGSVDKRLGEHASHSIARETAVRDRLQQQVSAEGSSLEHLSQRIRANNIVLHGVQDIAAHSRPADLTRYVSNNLDTVTLAEARLPKHYPSPFRLSTTLAGLGAAKGLSLWSSPRIQPSMRLSSSPHT